MYVFETPVEAADDPVGASVDADPEHMAWLDQVALARQSVEDRADCQPAALEGAILKNASKSKLTGG